MYVFDVVIILGLVSLDYLAINLGLWILSFILKCFGNYMVAELKKQIEKFYEGDEEALPSIFEAILKRKLAGIRDDELVEELGIKPPVDDVDDKEFDSDFDESDESEDEIDD